MINKIWLHTQHYLSLILIFGDGISNHCRKRFICQLCLHFGLKSILSNLHLYQPKIIDWCKASSKQQTQLSSYNLVSSTHITQPILTDTQCQYQFKKSTELILKKWASGIGTIRRSDRIISICLPYVQYLSAVFCPNEPWWVWFRQALLSPSCQHTRQGSINLLRKHHVRMSEYDCKKMKRGCWLGF
jgi:hypothetical protein